MEKIIDLIETELFLKKPNVNRTLIVRKPLPLASLIIIKDHALYRKLVILILHEP